MDLIEKYADRVSTLLLLLLGPVSVAIAIGDVTGRDLGEKKTIAVVLGVVGVLCLAVGLERVAGARRLQRRLTLLEDSLTRLAGGIQLNSHDEIYDHATRLCCAMEHRLSRRIRFRTKGPARYSEAIADRLAQLKKSRLPATYQVVLACDADKLPADFVEKNEARGS